MSDKKEIATLSIKISVDSTDLDKLEAQLKRIEGLMVSSGLKRPTIVAADAAGTLDNIKEVFHNSGNKAFIAALEKAIDINIPVSHDEFTEFKQQVESEFSQLQSSIIAIQQTITDSDRVFAASLEHLRADIQSVKSGWQL
ncbi:hypothetical protein I6L80_11160 [Providencia rettgeri]|uniref:Uncharacterized protein n=1 Tax=Providencia rettgeri TaxID=587 RepID=A0A379FQW3_PRORE|nr:hypothetical protein I6L80_11160 [Providencia rettgeri]SUC31061.1 Uncharacterised protein [Providencia rettgeri]